MFEINVQEMSAEFFPCWKSAGLHLNRQVPGGIPTWIRAHPYPPFLEHLSFRLGNQLFFVRVVDADGMVRGPGTPQGLQTAAEGCRGYACLLPMKNDPTTGNWAAVGPGWGLIDAATQKPLDPPSLVTHERIEMSGWEIHDMAIQVVRGYLEKKGYPVMSWQNNPRVDPSIWFVGETAKPEWVVVRAAKYPENQALRPENWETIAQQCAPMSLIGHFASVALTSAEQPFTSPDEPAVPLWRGHALQANFSGLE